MDQIEKELKKFFYQKYVLQCDCLEAKPITEFSLLGEFGSYSFH